MTRVAVLGAGPAGVAAALELAEKGVEVSVFERRDAVGGNAGSFDVAGMRVDFGSHRLHPASDPQVLERIRSLLGDDLLTRPRHGRIRLMGRFIHFPLKPVDLLTRVHPRFAIGTGFDLVRQLLPFGARATKPGDENFASVLEAGLGTTICREFYFPYARKIWGLAPEALSAIQAHKRVSSNSIAKMLKRLMPGGTGSGGANSKGIFFYPRRAYGQISEAVAEAAEAAGARFVLGCRIEGVDVRGARPIVHTRSGDMDASVEVDHVFSTIPINALARLITPAPPEPVRVAMDSLTFRSMLLVYLALDVQQFTEYDAHYFPETEFVFSRLSEPKNYHDSGEPRGRTVLCAEIPCATDDAIWSEDAAALGQRVADGLSRAGLPLPVSPVEVHVERIPFAYPLYRQGYERHFAVLDDWVETVDRVLTFGRQGLYAHDNTHHAMYMAQAAARCLQPDGRIDAAEWARERKIFETHVVED
jgi:protoporphyrinogen oxidase